MSEYSLEVFGACLSLLAPNLCQDSMGTKFSQNVTTVVLNVLSRGKVSGR